MKTTFLILIITLACLSLFLPFQEFENMWADFAPDGSILSWSGEDLAPNHFVKGYELLLPSIIFIFVIVSVLFSALVKSQMLKLAAVIVSCLNFFLTIFLYFYLITPVEVGPGQMFFPPTPMLGYGYFFLLISTIVTIIYSAVNYNAPLRIETDIDQF